MENNEELPREELLEMLSFLEDIKTEAVEQEPENSAGAAAPSVGGDVAVQFEACLTSTEKLHAIEQELNYLLSNIDEFLKRLSYRNVNTEEVCFTRVVPAFLKTSQPFFNYLESTARNRSPGQPSMAQEIRAKLLQFSQQLCSRTEHLVLTYASHGYLTLDESDPLCGNTPLNSEVLTRNGLLNSEFISHSHFRIGECEVNNIELSIFRYCQPTPLVTLTRTGLYKRMRWNVKRSHLVQAEEEDENNRTEDATQEVEGEQGPRKEGGKQSITTEYYYLCHENVILVEGEALGEEKDRKPGEETLLMWSVGKWEPIYTDSGTEDISEWVLCAIPQGEYSPLLYLGTQEPSPCDATDCLLDMLLSEAGSEQHTPIP